MDESVQGYSPAGERAKLIHVRAEVPPRSPGLTRRRWRQDVSIVALSRSTRKATTNANVRPRREASQRGECASARCIPLVAGVSTSKCYYTYIHSNGNSVHTPLPSAYALSSSSLATLVSRHDYRTTPDRDLSQHSELGTGSTLVTPPLPVLCRWPCWCRSQRVPTPSQALPLLLVASHLRQPAES